MPFESWLSTSSLLSIDITANVLKEQVRTQDSYQNSYISHNIYGHPVLTRACLCPYPAQQVVSGQLAEFTMPIKNLRVLPGYARARPYSRVKIRAEMELDGLM